MAPLKQQPKKGSQFAAATAMLGKNQNMNLETAKSPVPKKAAAARAPNTKPNWAAKNGNKSTGNIGFSPSGVAASSNSGGINKNSKLAPPPFVSPGAGLPKKSKFPTSSYLDKPMGTPSRTTKPTVPSSPGGFAGLAFSPSPVKGGKPKLSFQAQSPTARNNSNKPTVPAQYYGGSYLNKGNDSKTNILKAAPPITSSTPEIADVKIEVKIDIQEKLRQRQKSSKPLPPKQASVPEHIRRAREREERQRRALEEIEYLAASLVQAAFLGWYARVQYPKLLEANAERLAAMRKKEEAIRKRDKAILTIQSAWRMYVPRKRYLFVRECRRRRARNEKKIKLIEKTIKNMPKTTKADIKAMKKEYEEKKKAFKKTIRKRMKEEDEKLEAIRKSGQDMIKYWESQNDLVKQQKEAIKNEQKVLEKQFELLAAKSEEIHKNFLSLQSWVEKRNEVIKKNGEVDQKCRHRYLPKYRADIAQRNKYCLTEFRIKERYRKEIKRILKEVEKRSKDPDLVKDCKKEMKAGNKEIAALPQVPVPEGLERWLK
jgi:IQ calmodulin-binding motif